MGTIREVFVLEDQATPALNRIISRMTEANRLSQQMAGSFTQAGNMARSASNSFEQMAGGIKDVSTETKRASSPLSGLVKNLKSMAGAYLGLQGAKSFISLADSMTQTTARLDMMNDGLQNTAELNNMIYESAQRSRGAYQDTADMVAKLGTLAGDAFNSSKEIVDFAEQLNKQITLSGASTQTASGAMLQLTQAMASGVLRGDELNSILEGIPTVAQSIADYMGVSTGKMRELASEGAVTAEVVKNALFNAAEKTNEKFEQMPMTWGQVWTGFKNTATMALQPVLGLVNDFANNFDQIAPVLAGAGAAAAAAAIGLKVMAAATWIADGAAKTFFTTLLTNPLTYIALAVGLVVYAIYQWVQSVGGLQIAWLIVVDNVLYAWDTLKIGFMTGVYAVQNWLDNLSLAWQATGNAIQDWLGDTKVGALTILQDMINGAIDLLNKFSGKINTIFGTSFAPIERVSFAATVAAENEAAKQARAQKLASATTEAKLAAEERASILANMTNERNTNRLARQQEIMEKQTEQLAGSGTSSLPASSPFNEIAGNVGDIAGSVGNIEKSVNMSDEDLKSLVDVAERRYVNNINLTSPTPVINITGQNTGNTAADRLNLANTIRDILVEQVASGSTRATAKAY